MSVCLSLLLECLLSGFGLTLIFYKTIFFAGNFGVDSGLDSSPV